MNSFSNNFWQHSWQVIGKYSFRKLLISVKYIVSYCQSNTRPINVSWTEDKNKIYNKLCHPSKPGLMPHCRALFPANFHGTVPEWLSINSESFTTMAATISCNVAWLQTNLQRNTGHRWPKLHFARATQRNNAENTKPQRRRLDRHTLVDVSGKPILNGHVPRPHAFTHCRWKFTAIQIKVVNCIKVVLDIIIAAITAVHIINKWLVPFHLFTCITDSTNTTVTVTILKPFLQRV